MGPEGDCGWVVRRATVDDAAELARLHVDVWEDAYRGLMPDGVFAERRANLSARVDRWRINLATSLAITTVVQSPTGLIGFASVGPGRDHDVAIPTEVWALYTRWQWWGRGVGQALFEAALGDRSAYLWVLHGNARAIAFYRREGFISDGTLRHDEYGTELRMRR